MSLSTVLAILTILSFLVLLLFSKNVRRLYLIFSVCSLPLIDIPVTSSAFGSLRVFDAISYLTFLFLFKDFVTSQTRLRPYYGLYLGLIAVLVIGSVASEFISYSLFSLLSIFPIFIYAKLLIDECLINEDFKDEILQFIKVVGIFSVTFLLAQVIFGLDFTFYSKLNTNTNGPDGLRYPGFFHDPQKFAQYLAIICFLYLPADPKDISFKHIAPFIICIIALLLTGGRSALLGLGGGLLVLFFMVNARIKIVIGLSILACIPLMYFSNMFITFDRASDFVNDYAFRNSIWKEAFDIFINNPVLGIGSGNYQNFVQYHSTDQYFIFENEIQFFDQPENGYLKVLVEYGMFGFMIFILFFLLPIINAVKSFVRNDNDLTYCYFIASIASWVIAFNSVYSISDRRIMIILVSLISFLIAFREQVAKQEE